MYETETGVRTGKRTPSDGTQLAARSMSISDTLRRIRYPDETSSCLLFTFVGLGMDTDPFSPPSPGTSCCAPHSSCNPCNHRSRRWLRLWENETAPRRAVEPRLFGCFSPLHAFESQFACKPSEHWVIPMTGQTTAVVRVCISCDVSSGFRAIVRVCRRDIGASIGSWRLLPQVLKSALIASRARGTSFSALRSSKFRTSMSSWAWSRGLIQRSFLSCRRICIRIVPIQYLPSATSHFERCEPITAAHRTLSIIRMMPSRDGRQSPVVRPQYSV